MRRAFARSVVMISAVGLLLSLDPGCGGSDTITAAQGSSSGTSLTGAGGAGGSGAGTTASSTSSAGGAGGAGGSGGAATTGTGGDATTGMGGGTTSSTTTSSTSTSTSTSGTGGAGGSPVPVVRLIAIGDTGEGNADQHLVGDRMSEKCAMVGGCDAVLVTGDNFYDNGVKSVDDPQWISKFEEPYDRPALNGLPFYAVLGNHDHGPTSTGNKQAQIDYSSLPVGVGPGKRLSAKWTMPAAHYEVQIGHVGIFAFDTVDFGNAQQKSTMKAKVAASNATWKIAVAHHPRFTSGEHYFDNQALGFLGMFDAQKTIYCATDMFLTGHDHDREIIDKGRDNACPSTYFVVSGAGAKVREAESFIPKDQKQLYYDDETEGFAYLEFVGNELHFEFIDKFGVVNFSKTIVK